MSGLASAAADRLAADDALKLIDRAAAAAVKHWKFSHSTDDFAACAAAARRVRLCSRAAGAISGAATGVGGLAALPADIASSLLILSGTVHATASAFGFRDNSPRDQLIRLHAIDLALKSSGHRRRGRKAAIDELLRNLEVSADRESAAALRLLAQAMLPGVLDNLIGWAVSRAGGKAVPVASAVTGGFLGYQLQNRAWNAASYTYSARWRIERTTLASPDRNGGNGAVPSGSGSANSARRRIMNPLTD